MKHLNSLKSHIKQNRIEYYALTMLLIGLPVVAWVYFDWRAALAVFVLVQVALGIRAVEVSK